MSTLTLDHKVVPSAEVLVQEVGGEALLLDLASEAYYGLDPVGTLIWQSIGDGAPLSKVLSDLEQFYPDVEREWISADLIALAAGAFFARYDHQ